MSEPTDIKALDEYLKGNSEVSQRYRELGADDVPPELDRRVLAAAREAVADEGAKPSRSWLRWSAPVALAASVVLALAVFLENGLQNDKAVVMQSSEPPAGFVPVVPVPAPPARHADIPPGPEPKVADVRRFRESVPVPQVKLEQEVAPAASVAAAAAAPPEQAQPREERMDEMRKSLERNAVEADAASEAQDTVMTSSSHSRRATGRAAGPRSAGTVSGGFASETRALADDRADKSDPLAWLEEIRELRRAGKIEDADHEWQLFRDAFPSFHVADDDLARKKQ